MNASAGDCSSKKQPFGLHVVAVYMTTFFVVSFLALFMRSGITGVPIGFAEGLPTFLIALAAMVIGRMENLVVIAIAACMEELNFRGSVARLLLYVVSATAGSLVGCLLLYSIGRKGGASNVCSTSGR